MVHSNSEIKLGTCWQLLLFIRVVTLGSWLYSLGSCALEAGDPKSHFMFIKPLLKLCGFPMY